jgi:hypothetical protein
VSSTSPVAVGIVCVALALVGYAFGRFGPARSDAMPMPTPASDAAPVGIAKPRSEKRTPGPATRYAELATRADDGERDAAVALVELLRPCAHRAMLDNEALHMEAMLDEDSPARRHFAKHPKALDALAKHAEVASASAREADDACAEMTPEQVLARSHWLYRAAELGDARSALEYGRGDFLRYEPLTHLDEVAFWRDHAESMLQRAMEGGEREALALLASGYDPSRERLLEGPRFAPDPVAAYAYYTAWSLSSDRIDVQVEGALDRLDRELGETDRARAREQAAAICANDLPLVCGPDAPEAH